VIRQTNGHSGRDPQRFVNPPKIVVHGIPTVVVAGYTRFDRRFMERPTEYQRGYAIQPAEVLVVGYFEFTWLLRVADIRVQPKWFRDKWLPRVHAPCQAGQADKAAPHSL